MENMREFYTDAPQAYDYSYVIRNESPYELKHINSYRPLFHVRIPEQSAEYQTMRYMSGNHVAWTPEKLQDELQYSFVRVK